MKFPNKKKNAFETFFKISKPKGHIKKECGFSPGVRGAIFNSEHT